MAWRHDFLEGGVGGLASLFQSVIRIEITLLPMRYSIFKMGKTWEIKKAFLSNLVCDIA